MLQLKILADYDPSKNLFFALEERVNKGDINLIDGHGHAFASNDVPPDFLIDRLPGFQRLLCSPVIGKKVLTPLLTNIMKGIWPFSNKDILDRTANYVAEGNNTTEQILQDWFNLYPEHVAVVVLMMDFAQAFSEPSPVSYYDQVTNLMHIATQDQLRGKVLPFVFFDARRPNAIEILEYAFNAGAAGAKAYPSLGSLPTHPNAMPVWSRLTELGLPVITHCSPDGMVHTHNSKIIVHGRYDDQGNPLPDKEERFGIWPGQKNWNSYFNEPKNWRPVLAQNEKFKLVIAHGTGDIEIKKFMNDRRSTRSTWLGQVFEMMYDFENVYFDVSFVSNQEIIRRFFCDEILGKDGILNKIAAERITYGSDFYMSDIGKNPEDMVKDNLRDYQPYLRKIGLENTMRLLRPNPKK